MSITYLPPNQEIYDLFVDEVRELGCFIPEVHHETLGFYARATFSHPVEVRPGDAVRGGVALRAIANVIDVHPFVYRQVCSNGAIVVSALESRHVQRVGFAAPSVEITFVLEEVQAAVRACGQPEVFTDAAEAMRRATRAPSLPLIAAALALARSQGIAAVDLQKALAELQSHPRATAFDVINAITALARVARDAERRWRLEGLGGGMLALIPRVRRFGPAGANLPEEELIDACA